MLLLNDKELLEGVSGATGFILFSVLLTKYSSLDPIVELFFAWILVWYFRKIVNNIYVQKFKTKDINLMSFYF